MVPEPGGEPEQKSRRPSYNRFVISVAEALAIIASNALPLEEETTAIAAGVGRVLARPIRCDVDWPPFDTSAMDGYAVRIDDLPPCGEPVRERESIVAAGDPPPAPLAPGEAARIMTGAPLPEGADAVIPVERSRRESGVVRFDAVPSRGEHIRRRGESIRAGATLLARGRRIRPADLALTALAGADPLPVFRTPRVRIVTTGNELVDAARVPAPGQLRDSNGPMLRAACERHGWPVTLESAVRDEPARIARLFAARPDEPDVLLTCGGVSAGDLDLLPDAAADAGFSVLFAKIAMRPGKPLRLSRRGRTLWFGLPGNPVSAAVTFHLFAREALARLEGDAFPAAPRVLASVDHGLRGGGARESYREAIWGIEEGRSRVRSLASRGSHDLGAFAGSNALIRTGAGAPPRPAGSLVECVLLDGAPELPYRREEPPPAG